MTAVRHLLSCLLLLIGLADLRLVTGEAHAGQLWARGQSPVVAIEFVPCRDGRANGSAEIAVPDEFLPDLLPPERESDAVAAPPACGFHDLRFAEARHVPADHVFGRSPGHGFSSRAPPLSS